MNAAHVYKPRQELRPKNLSGISEDQIEQHWKLYEGYVKNVNEINAEIAHLAKMGDFGAEFSELKRRLGFEYDGMVLHEHYFSILKPGYDAPGDSSDLVKLLKRSFGGFAAWKKEFTAVAKMRGVGWAILYLDPREHVLSTHWINLHESGHPAGFAPILVLDVWEHAYMVDWGAGGRADYLEAFFKNINWPRVEKHLQEAARLVFAA
jgi:superoxide dismutase, Fe-Mn family